MQRARIAAGTDDLRPGRGGPLARLFISSLAFLAAAAGAWAQDPLETAFGTDYGRQLLPGSVAPSAGIGALPGFPPPRDTGSPKLALGAEWGSRDLIGKRPARRGEFGYAHDRTLTALEISTAAIPGVELRGTATRSRLGLRLGDSSTSVDMGDEGWGWRAAASIRLTPLLVPSVVVGGESSTRHGNALEAFAVEGALPAGLSWSFATGRVSRDFPVELDLEGYDAIRLPLQSRQRFSEAALRLAQGPWETYWSGRLVRSGRPRVPASGYALFDSGSVWRQRALGAYSAGGWRASLDFELGAGGHVFRGRNRKGETYYPFSWQEGIQKDYSVRADFRLGGGRRAQGAWLAAGETEYDAVRPEIAFNRHFWDRNGVIDSYEGSVLGVFNNETWLLNGAAYAAHAAAGAWIDLPLWGWDHRFAGGYRYLMLQANSTLTRRETTFILAYTEETFAEKLPTVEADLIPVEWRLERAWGNLSLEMDARAEIPVRIRVHGEKDPGPGGEGNGGATYTGGTAAGIRLSWRLP